MATCPRCAEDISATELTCPHCGSTTGIIPQDTTAATQRQRSRRLRSLAIVLTAIGVGVAGIVVWWVAERRGRDTSTPAARMLFAGSCENAMAEYERALGAAGETAENLPETGCATTAGTDLLPVEPLSQRCKDLWTHHFAAVQHAVDLNASTRAACPHMQIPSMGVVPSSLRIHAPVEGSTSSDAGSSGAVPKRHDFTADGIPLSALIPAGASPSSRATGKGTMHAEVGWPSSIVVKDGKQVLDDPRVDITDWPDEKCADEAQQLAKMAPDGARVERNEHAAGRNVLSYKNSDGSYGGFVCEARVGYHCLFDFVAASIATKALEVCLTVERVSGKPASPASPATIALADVQRLIDAQATALMGSGFTDSFAESAIAFFPHTLQPFEGRTRIGDGAREAWTRTTNVDRAAVVVGIDWSVAWATTQWTITLADLKGTIPVRVTELLSQDTNGLHVIAASFSVAPARRATVIADPVPSFAVGVPPDGGPASWLSFPEELATHLHVGDATSLIGSDTNEVALDADEARKLLIKWKNVKLEFVGNMRVIDGAGYKVVLAFARWRRPKPTLFRVLGLFVRGEVMAGPAPWELATAHYSVAVPGDRRPNMVPSPPGPATRSQATPSWNLTNNHPVSVMLVTQSGGTAFEAWENGKKILDGPGGVEVAPGQPRTLTIRARGWKERTLVVDGKTERMEFKLELLPDCGTTLADPKNAECRAQFCEGHGDDVRCRAE